MSLKAIILLLPLTCMVAEAAEIVLYDYTGGKGEYFAFQYPDHSYTCYNIPIWFNDRASSINTKGKCVYLYEHTNCGGRDERIAPGTPYHGDLGRLGFDNKATSVRACM